MLLILQLKYDVYLPQRHHFSDVCGLGNCLISGNGECLIVSEYQPITFILKMIAIPNMINKLIFYKNRFVQFK